MPKMKHDYFSSMSRMRSIDMPLSAIALALLFFGSLVAGQWLISVTLVLIVALAFLAALTHAYCRTRPTLLRWYVRLIIAWNIGAFAWLLLGHHFVGALLLALVYGIFSCLYRKQVIGLLKDASFVTRS